MTFKGLLMWSRRVGKQPSKQARKQHQATQGFVSIFMDGS